MPMKISRFDGSNTWHGRAWHGCHVAGSSYAADDAEISVIHSGSDVFDGAYSAFTTNGTINTVCSASSTTTTSNQIQEKQLKDDFCIRINDGRLLERNKQTSSID